MTRTRAIKLSNDLILEAHKYAAVYSRSVPKQIEHWAKIGKIAEDNPDLSYEFIGNILKARAEMDSGNVSPFEYRFE